MLLRLPNEVVKPENVDFVFPVATVFEKTLKKLDIKDITSSDLASLKKSDPFMYYSIPAIRKATLHCTHLDLSTVSNLTSDQVPRTSSDRSSESEVTRKSRISFECHTDLLLEDLMDNFNSDYCEPMGQNDLFKHVFSCNTRQ
ncbi:hypothetical protein HJC23_008467 [Cyclotella cryptica]|uniref:Uncharacterized protein n=1 Tax=Cyclotella cryptica TaxID=29204 RepID=A0ABD3QX63_9STRA